MEFLGLSTWLGPFPKEGKSGEEQVVESAGGVRNHLFEKKNSY